ncbi:MAG: flagella basal body P-ring formation protein FlgA [Edaphobacter sp.]
MCLIVLAGLQSAGATAFAAGCARTPAAAARLAGVNISDSSMPEDKGYRVTSVRWDPVMQQSWATIVSCEHPEWPGVSLRTRDANNTPSGLSAAAHEQRSPIIRAGDVVELWRQEDLLRIEVAAVAEQSGGVGETIRVRLVRRPGTNQAAEEQFNGVIRGREDVEMQP